MQNIATIKVKGKSSLTLAPRKRLFEPAEIGFICKTVSIECFVGKAEACLLGKHEAACYQVQLKLQTVALLLTVGLLHM